MAAESPNQRSDEATLTSAPEPTTQIDADSQNGILNRPHVNGDAPVSATDEFENKHISDIVDDLVNSTEVSISGGSDNEAAKSDASKTKDDAKSHARASSTVRKPASFKAVKVNRTFLNAKGAAPVPESKQGEKAASTVTAAPAPTGTPTGTRPRLVAKSGSGLITKSAGVNGAKPGAAPDANAVWNKNRPVPPPEPKKYTDEELQKYGIHMATRLQSGDAKGQSNWADIDDDDEDWAPDTITWKDGTKIAITHTEDQPAPPPPPAPVARPVAREIAPLDKPKSPAPGTSPSVKPGVLASGRGLVLKGAPEKPTLVAKPPAPPTPAKSPWATLPKIDKVSPVAADVPTQEGPKYPPREMPTQQQQQQHYNAPPPPKEIAADDFSRAPWRDGPSGANRELFNSQSGRYEPVLDRRGSMRSEPQHGRQPPALLQRPPHHEQAPIDSASAFQAGRNNEQQGPYGRRRGSSNVSGGSGSWQRIRGGEHPLPPPELANARRASLTGGSDGPASPKNFSPSHVQGGPPHGQGGPPHGQPWPAGASPAAAHATPYHSGAQAPDGRGMPPPNQQPPTVPVTEEDYEVQKRLMRERRELAMRRRQEEEAKEEAARRERIRLKLEALGPAPESNSAKKAAAKEQAPTPTQIQAREHPSPQQPAPAEPHVAERDAASTAEPESAKQVPSQPNGQAQPHSASDSIDSHGHAHPWVPSARQAERRPPVSWGPQPSTTKNVWGAPNNNRSLGNGTFAADIGPAPLVQLPGQSGPGPIAPPTSTRNASGPQVALPAPTQRQPPIGPPRQPQAARGPAGERDVKDNAWAAAVRLNDGKFTEMLNAQYEERDRRLQAEGRTLQDIQPAIKDTWRPTTLDDSGMRTEAASKQTVQIGQDNPWAASADSKPSVATQQQQTVSGGAASEYNQLPPTTAPARDVASASILSAKTAAAQQTRGSRFFPSRHEPGRDHRQETGTDAARHRSPSPPPPDMVGHPAFDGDATHPHVSLPRPQPVVRLPPSAIRETQARGPESNKASFGQVRSQGPSFAWASQAAYKEREDGPRVNSQEADNGWQTKIYNLLGKQKAYPSPRGVAGVDGAGRHAPQHAESFSAFEQDSSVTTKGMDAECFEEPEMGSLPPVRLPKTTPEMAWQPCPAPQPLAKKLRPVVSSAEPLTFPVDVSGAGTVWRVCIPGHESKNITVPFGRTRSNPRRGGQRGSRHATGGGQHRQGKGREPSSSYPAEQGASGSASNNSHGRSHRGNYRGRGENWSRNTTNQAQT